MISSLMRLLGNDSVSRLIQPVEKKIRPFGRLKDRKKGWEKKVSRAVGNNGVLARKVNSWLLERRLGEGNPNLHWKPREKSTLKWQSGIQWGGANYGTHAQLSPGRRAAEANPPRDTAPLGCCCACAGVPVTETSLPPVRPPRILPVTLSLALSSFARRRVCAPLAPSSSEAGEEVGGGCCPQPLSCARGGHVGRRGRAPSVGAERRDRRGWGGRVALWRYGTSCPFSLSRFSQASPPGLQTVGVPGPSRRRLGPLVRILLRPKSGWARCARFSAPRPRALPTPPTCTHPAAAGSNLGRWHGAWPSASPSSSPRLLGRLAFAHITLVFISILSSVHVFLLAPWL